MRRYDPKRIADNLRDIQDGSMATSVPPSSDGRIPTQPPHGLSPDGEASDSEAWESFAEWMEEKILPGLDRSVRIDALPPGTRFAAFKRLIHRALRLVSAKQVSFNFYASVALRGMLEHLREVNAALRMHEEAIRRESAELGRRFDDIQNDLVGRTEAQRHESARLHEETLTQVQARLRQSLRALGSQTSSTSPPVGGAAASSSPDEAPLTEELAYQLFEDAWRGTPETIRRGQQEYVLTLKPFIEKLEPDCRMVLDLGCGPGGFLQALLESKIEGVGVDINRAAVSEARDKGLNVEAREATAYLAERPDNRLGAITAFQFVEHLTPGALRRLVDRVYSKLAPGGVALFETLNPATFAAYRWFMMDLTHRRFLPPETLRFLCECAGLEHVETRMIHPVPEHERLRETGDETELANIRRLNETLFGYRDYLLLARKPTAAEEGPTT
ncbi:methyltransferase domain-containing protein [Candidatus Sumerlaeota bacterium]|nr:methyltransferase domain-containing protein [Candidatus Sumerlaeota bacterium]